MRIGSSKSLSPGMVRTLSTRQLTAFIYALMIDKERTIFFNTNGDDATAQPGEENLPYDTMQGAIDAGLAAGGTWKILIQSGPQKITESFRLTGDISITVEDYHELSPFQYTTNTSATAYTALREEIETDLAYDRGSRVYFEGTITLGNFGLGTTWAAGNYIEGFNVDIIHLEQTLVQSGVPDRYGWYIRDIICDSVTKDAGITETGGTWDRVHNTDGGVGFMNFGAGDTISGYFNDCGSWLVDTGWNADVNQARYKRCIGVGNCCAGKAGQAFDGDAKFFYTTGGSSFAGNGTGGMNGKVEDSTFATDCIRGGRIYGYMARIRVRNGFQYSGGILYGEVDTIKVEGITSEVFANWVEGTLKNVSVDACVGAYRYLRNGCLIDGGQVYFDEDGYMCDIQSRGVLQNQDLYQTVSGTPVTLLRVQGSNVDRPTFRGLKIITNHTHWAEANGANEEATFINCDTNADESTHPAPVEVIDGIWTDPGGDNPDFEIRKCLASVNLK